MPTAQCIRRRAFDGLREVIVMIMVGDAFRSWHGHRTKLSEVAGKDEAGNNIIPPPRWHPSSAWLMLWLMPIACVLFYYFNPLR